MANTISTGGDGVNKIEYITRIQVDGKKEIISGKRACEIVRQRIEEALEGMNYEKKKAAG